MLKSSKLVLKACKSLKQNDIHLDVAGSEINDGLKNVEINEIKSLTFPGLNLASNVRPENWREDETVERRPPDFLVNYDFLQCSELEKISKGTGLDV